MGLEAAKFRREFGCDSCGEVPVLLRAFQQGMLEPGEQGCRGVADSRTECVPALLFSEVARPHYPSQRCFGREGSDQRGWWTMTHLVLRQHFN